MDCPSMKGNISFYHKLFFFQLITTKEYNTVIDGLTLSRERNFFFYDSIHVNLPAGAFFSQFWGSLPSLPSTFKIFCLWKKSSTIKSWPTFCNQYFWKFPIWNSRADEKRREIRMVKVNVIFNDIRLLICLTPLQVNWVMVIN